MAKSIIVSNRVMLPSSRNQAGGLAVALKEALSKTGGIWCGWSGNIGDGRDTQTVKDAGIRYLTMDYTQEEYDGFYLGYANSMLWPLFHYRIGLTHFSQETYMHYRQVNDRYAQMLAGYAKAEDVIWVHDYHFLTLAEGLRERNVQSRIGFFLHIPFPAPEVLRAAPMHRELLEAMCAYDLIGFQTEGDTMAFRHCIEEFCDATLLSSEDGLMEMRACGRRLRIGAFPISIDTAEMEAAAEDAENHPNTQDVQCGLGERKLIIGVDRLDYSKGLLSRLEAYRHFLTHYPREGRESSYIQITPPSRTAVEEYRELREELERQAAHINGIHATINHTPIHYLCQSFSRDELAGLYRLADVGLVTPLRDGMNLVAKEYVASQDASDPGVLVLSEFAGAAQELQEALIINPHDHQAVGEAIHTALTMPLEERRERHAAMLSTLRNHTIHDWTAAFMSALQSQDVVPRYAPYSVVSG